MRTGGGGCVCMRKDSEGFKCFSRSKLEAADRSPREHLAALRNNRTFYLYLLLLFNYILI